MNLYGYEFQRDSDLAHYGVIGMKWGVRRYQNADGSLTDVGRRQMRLEKRKDNRTAYEYGRDATIAARAHSYSKKQLEKAEKRYSRKENEKNLKKLNEAKKLEKEFAKREKVTADRCKKHYDSMVKKYGAEKVSAIKYDKQGRINEKVHTSGDYFKSLVWKSGVSKSVSTTLGLPISAIYRPSTKNEMGKSVYKSNGESADSYHRRIIFTDKVLKSKKK